MRSDSPTARSAASGYRTRSAAAPTPTGLRGPSDKRLLIRSIVRVAAHVLVPIHERAGRALLPRPDVQRVERRQSEAVRCAEVMEDLAVELRCLLVRLVPGRRVDQVVGAGEFRTPGGRLVQDDFRLVAVD